MKSMTLAGAVAGLVAFAAPAANAAPVTVDLRVEGPTRTLVEQKVTVDVREFKFSNSAQRYRCDGTGSTGTTTTPSPTRGGAIAEAAERTPFELLGTFGQFGASFSRINGEGVAFNSTTNEFLVEYKNGVAAQVGACGDPIVSGDDVLFGYGRSSARALRLDGPATVAPGARATLRVTDRADSSPIVAASVAGGTSGPDGRVTTAPLNERGPQSFKASRTNDIRSNAVTVCVTDGSDGFCGTTKPGEPATAPTDQGAGAAPDPASPSAPGSPAAPASASSPAGMQAAVVPDTLAAFAKIKSITERRRFARGRGPRTLAGLVDPERSGIKDVRIRLSRTDAKRCSRYDGARERFVRTRRCGIKNARTFSVGSGSRFSYLLPAALPRGRYVLDVIVIDRAFNQTLTYQRGRNRVVFFVG